MSCLASGLPATISLQMLRSCFLVNVKTYSNVFNVIGRAVFLHCLGGILEDKTPAGKLIPIVPNPLWTK